MGLSLGYQALPEDSSLYRLLIDNRRIGELFARLFLYGGGPFAPVTNSMDDFIDELSDLLDHLVKYSEVFESRGQAEETVRYLFEVVDRAIARYPGLEKRRVFLDKTHDWIKERLLEVMRSRGYQDQADQKLAEHLIYGWCEGFPNPAPDLPLTVLPSSVVRQGAELLREFTPEVLFEDRKHFLHEYYGRWRELYLGAAERGEVILIGS